MSSATGGIVSGGGVGAIQSTETRFREAQGSESSRGASREAESAVEETRPAARTPRAVDIHFDPPSERWYVVVKDRPNGKVIRTIPPEEMLRAIGRIKRMVGLVLDERR